tara:strand:+ start:487 stop:1098 length:612 start_codon:yes stop_codon:yes gene_type:complete
MDNISQKTPKLNTPTSPRIEFPTLNHWKDAVLIMIHNIHRTILDTIHSDDFDVLYFKSNCHQINYNQRKNIINSIIKGLVSLSKSINWSTKHAYIAIRHIDAIFYSFNYINTIPLLNKDTICEIMFRNISYYIGYDEDDTVCDGIIEYIPVYKCANCLELKNFVVNDNDLYMDKNICYSCNTKINNGIELINKVVTKKYKKQL